VDNRIYSTFPVQVDKEPLSAMRSAKKNQQHINSTTESTNSSTNSAACVTDCYLLPKIPCGSGPARATPVQHSRSLILTSSLLALTASSGIWS